MLATSSGAPFNTTVPSVSGADVEGQTLTSTDGVWSPDGTSYTYQWQRSAGGGAWSDIDDATSASYTLAAADVGDQVNVEVSAANDFGSANADSAASSTILSGAPANTALPIVTGGPTRGYQMTASAGSWSPDPASYPYQWQYAYQWQRNEGAGFVNVPGARASTYTPSLTEESDTFRVTVTATDIYGQASAQSGATGPVLPDPPSNSTAPMISGTARRADTLTMTSSGAWTGTDDTYTYLWQHSSDNVTWVSIAGATAETYTLAAADDGDYVRILVTASNPDGSVSQGSQPTTAVQSVPPLNTLAPAITGTAQRSFKLTASQGTWTGIGDTYTYLWQRSPDGLTWTSIMGATAKTYTLAAADEGDYVRALVTASNPDASVSQGSQPTTAVQSASALNTLAPTITGTAKRTGKLTMTSAGAWIGIGNKYSDQWQRSPDSLTWTSITGATAKTYTLAAADDGDYVRVLVTATNPDGSVSQGSKPTTAVQSAPPLGTLAPTITGAAKLAGKLTMTSAGAWIGIGNKYSDQWQRSPDGLTWTSIAGATAKTYTLAAADEGDYVRVLVTAANPAGSASQGSQPTTVVQSASALLHGSRQHRGAVRVIGVRLGAADGAGQQPPEGGSLGRVESLQDVVLNRLLGARRTLQGFSPGASYVHAVAPAVLGVAAPDQVAQVL
ncbi:MAG: hypothetical protein ACLP8S_09605 [Solirubrobacteraceae bacterium]